MIHEFLHTLGLGENPPTSQAITEQVAFQVRLVTADPFAFRCHKSRITNPEATAAKYGARSPQFRGTRRFSSSSQFCTTTMLGGAAA